MLSVKIYRKFLILAVLSGSLFVFSSVNRAGAADPCCGPRLDACDNAYSTCVINCHVYIGIPPKYAECTSACELVHLNCYMAAEPCNPTCR